MEELEKNGGKKEAGDNIMFGFVKFKIKEYIDILDIRERILINKLIGKTVSEKKGNYSPHFSLILSSEFTKANMAFISLFDIFLIFLIISAFSAVSALEDNLFPLPVSIHSAEYP